jgi:DNA-binding MarR family transcriptional regulator
VKHGSGSARESVEPKWLDPVEQAAWRGLLETHAQLTGVLGRELVNESGLSIQDYAVLVSLSESPAQKMRVLELARTLAWEKSRLSHHIARMAGRGLVKRERCPTDQRGAFIVLTARGRRAIEAAAPGHVAGVRRWFVDLLTPGEMATLAAIAEKIIKTITESQGECGNAGCDS